MGLLFDRRTELHIFTGTVKTIIKDLHMEFEIEAFAGSGPKSNPNTAKITVYNNNEPNRKLFSEEHQAIEFYAGYKADMGLIFVGETTNVTVTEEKTRWVTNIYAGDGIKDWTTKFFNKPYNAGQHLSQILKNLCESFGLPYTIDIFDDVTLLSSETHVGLAKDVLTDICKDYGLEWSIQWGAVEITQKDSPFTSDPLAIVLSPDTGMIGQPVLIDRTKSKKKKGKKEKRTFGVRVTSLMNSQIRPKRLVQIKSETQINQSGKLMTKQTPKRDVNGIYIVDTVRYFGKSWTGEYYTQVEADLQ